MEIEINIKADSLEEVSDLFARLKKDKNKIVVEGMRDSVKLDEIENDTGHKSIIPDDSVSEEFAPTGSYSWQPQEDDVLAETIGKILSVRRSVPLGTYSKLSEKLKRTQQAIRSRVTHLKGIGRLRDYSEHSKHELGGEYNPEIKLEIQRKHDLPIFVSKKKPKQNKGHWSGSECQILRDLILSKKNKRLTNTDKKTLARQFNRSLDSVKTAEWKMFNKTEREGSIWHRFRINPDTKGKAKIDQKTSEGKSDHRRLKRKTFEFWSQYHDGMEQDLRQNHNVVNNELCYKWQKKSGQKYFAVKTQLYNVKRKIKTGSISRGLSNNQKYMIRQKAKLPVVETPYLKPIDIDGLSESITDADTRKVFENLLVSIIRPTRNEIILDHNLVEAVLFKDISMEKYLNIRDKLFSTLSFKKEILRIKKIKIVGSNIQINL